MTARAWRADAARRREAGESAQALAREYGVSRSTIYRLPAPELMAAQERTTTTSPMAEVGMTGLTRFGGSVFEDYQREWQSLSKMVPLVKEMLNYPVVGSVMFAVEMSMRQVEWSVVPASEDQADIEAAEFLEGCMNDMSMTFDDHISQALTMLPYGFSPFEVVYKRRLGPDRDPESQYDDGRVGWRKFAFRSQDTLAPGDEWIFDENGGIQGMRQSAPPDYRPVTIPIDKLLLYRTTSAKNNPQGRSVLRPAYISWYYSKTLSQLEGIAAERMGTGFPVMYLGDGTRPGADGDMSFAKQVVRDTKVDEQMGLVIPYPKQTAEGRGVLFELLSPPSRGMVDFDQVIERYNRQIAQTVLAQFIFLGMTEQGTQALAVRSTDFFSEAISAWLKSMADTLNRYAVPRLFRLNGSSFAGITGFPKFEVGPAGQIDVAKLMGAIEAAVRAGALVPDEAVERTIRKVLELPERAEEVEQAPAEPDLSDEEVPPEEMGNSELILEAFNAVLKATDAAGITKRERAPSVVVHLPEIRNEITTPQPSVSLQAIMPPSPAPQVTVQPSDVRPEFHAHVPPQPAPLITVKVPKLRKSFEKQKIKRKNNQIDETEATTDYQYEEE